MLDPLRLVVPGCYAVASVKWLTGIRSSWNRSRAEP
jgi:DMSO/TMAO reductase YedYZ molybdopterin-dependent catalytic subunit